MRSACAVLPTHQPQEAPTIPPVPKLPNTAPFRPHSRDPPSTQPDPNLLSLPPSLETESDILPVPLGYSAFTVLGPKLAKREWELG